jgi:hypothetical protein
VLLTGGSPAFSYQAERSRDRTYLLEQAETSDAKQAHDFSVVGFFLVNYPICLLSFLAHDYRQTPSQYGAMSHIHSDRIPAT